MRAALSLLLAVLLLVGPAAAGQQGGTPAMTSLLEVEEAFSSQGASVQLRALLASLQAHLEDEQRQADSEFGSAHGRCTDEVASLRSAAASKTAAAAAAEASAEEARGAITTKREAQQRWARASDSTQASITNATRQLQAARSEWEAEDERLQAEVSQYTELVATVLSLEEELASSPLAERAAARLRKASLASLRSRVMDAAAAAAAALSGQQASSGGASQSAAQLTTLLRRLKATLSDKQSVLERTRLSASTEWQTRARAMSATLSQLESNKKEALAAVEQLRMDMAALEAHINEQAPLAADSRRSADALAAEAETRQTLCDHLSTAYHAQRLQRNSERRQAALLADKMASRLGELLNAASDGHSAQAQQLTSALHYTTRPWGECSAVCGGGIRRRVIACASYDGARVDLAACQAAGLLAPVDEERCNAQACMWRTGDWGECSAVCGGGTATRKLSCHAMDGTPYVAPPPTDDSPVTDAARAAAAWVIAAGDGDDDDDDDGDAAAAAAADVVSVVGSSSHDDSDDDDDDDSSDDQHHTTAHAIHQQLFDDSACPGAGPPPASTRDCAMDGCVWVAGKWGACSTTCGAGEMRRVVNCTTPTGDFLHAGDVCAGGGQRPPVVTSCDATEDCVESFGISRGTIDKRTVCGRALASTSQPSSAKLACLGGRIASIELASFGLATGSCPAYTPDAACSTDVRSQAEAACVGSERCQLPADATTLQQRCTHGTVLTLVANCELPHFCAESKPGEPSLLLKCPLGRRISSVAFASFGYPTGECGSWAKTAGCHSPKSSAWIVQAKCAGKHACRLFTKDFGSVPDGCQPASDAPVQPWLAVDYQCTSD